MSKPGSMLSPCVARYVVPPPNATGQNSHTAVSTSAQTALMLTVRIAASMAKAPVPEPAGRPTDHPA